MPSAPLFAQRDFTALWWGQFVSMLGDRLTYLALFGVLLHHTDSFADATQSSVLLGVLGNMMLLPVLLFAPFVGPWLDRWNLRTTLLASDLLRGVFVAAIPFAYDATQHVGSVFTIVFLMFTCNVFFLPAKSAMTPEIVPGDQLLAANTLLSVAGIAATAGGALAGGWVVDHLGWRMALWIDAVTYGISVLTLALIRYAPGARDRHAGITLRGYARDLAEGVRLVWAQPRIGLALTALGAVWIGGGFVQVAGNQHIQRAASIPGTERIGILMAVLGVGAGLGTWWVNAHGRNVPRPLLLGVGLVLSGVWLGLFALSTHFAVFAVAGFLIGLCIAPTFVLTETLLQEGADLRQRGRVFSLRDFAMRLGFQLAIWVAVVLTPLTGTRTTMLVAAAVVSVTGALAFVWARRAPELMSPR